MIKDNKNKPIFEMETFYCPGCKKELDRVQTTDPIDRNPPKSGDFNICSSCRTVSQFNENLQLRTVSQEDLDKLGEEERNCILDGLLYLSELKKLSETKK